LRLLAIPPKVEAPAAKATLDNKAKVNTLRHVDKKLNRIDYSLLDGKSILTKECENIQIFFS
jgi:hypothetical protein